MEQLPEYRLKQLQYIHDNLHQLYDIYEDFKEWLMKEIPDISYDLEDPFFELWNTEVLFSAIYNKDRRNNTVHFIEIDRTGKVITVPEDVWEKQMESE